MPSPAYYVWIGSGKPYKLMRPAAALQRVLRARGLTVYDYPDESHLKASAPEDHTPFSATGWPVKSAFGVGHAIDVMPRSDSAAGRKESADIARRLVADRNAGVSGVAWIKYINWTDEQGVCRQERWTPNHTTRSSSDRGHIHISGRSDCDDDARADGYDPLTSGGLSVGASEVILAYANGNTKATTGESVEPVKWRIKDEQWQKSVTEQLAQRPPVALTDADRQAIAALVVEQLADLLPTVADIEAAVDAKVRAALNSTHLSTS